MLGLSMAVQFQWENEIYFLWESTISFVCCWESIAACFVRCFEFFSFRVHLFIVLYSLSAMSYWIGVFWISNSVYFFRASHRFCLNVRVCAHFFFFVALNMNTPPRRLLFALAPLVPFFISFGHYLLYATQWCFFFFLSHFIPVFVCALLSLSVCE